MKPRAAARPFHPIPATADWLGVLLSWVGRWSLVEATIGVAWQENLSAALGLSVSWEQNLLVFVGLWLGYTVDHYLDAARLPQAARLAPRHLLHRTAPRRSGYLLITALALAILIATVRLQPVQQATCVCVTLLAGGYLWLAHWRRTRALFRKELAAALIYPVGTGTFIWPELSTLPMGNPWCLWLAVGAFCGLVLANLGIISHAEAAQDQACGEGSLARRYPNSRALLTPTCALCAAVALLGILACQASWRPYWLTVLGSATALAAVATRLDRLAPERAHWLVDVALLGPALVPLMA